MYPSDENRILTNNNLRLNGDLAALNGMYGGFYEEGDTVRPIMAIWCDKDYDRIDIEAEARGTIPITLLQQLEWKSTLSLAQVLTENVYGEHKGAGSGMPVGTLMQRLEQTGLYRATQLLVPGLQMLPGSEVAKLNRFAYTAVIN